MTNKDKVRKEMGKIVTLDCDSCFSSGNRCAEIAVDDCPPDYEKVDQILSIKVGDKTIEELIEGELK